MVGEAIRNDDTASRMGEVLPTPNAIRYTAGLQEEEMKITVEMKKSDESYSYILFEEACAVYVETENGLTMRQDNELPGYRITEADSGNARE